MIPQLRDLEQRFPNELVIIGVHSGKYSAERDTARIRDASIRLGSTHPIINDRQFRVWRSYAVNAWPTIVIVDPSGYVIGQQAGEFTVEQLAPAIEELIAKYDADGTLDRRPMHFAADPANIPPGRLHYPGKVIVDGARIAISDSGNSRVLVGSLDVTGRRMTIERTITGDAAPNGFASPQGMAFDGDTLYVADALRHGVFAAARDGSLRMIAGTGHQIRARADLTNGSLSSPWDVALVGRTLFIASAGSHQIHALDLDAAPGKSRVRVHAGTRREEIMDGPNAEAALAQPMGLAVSSDRVYFADAETSAIRWSEIDPAGAVRTIVGTGLFDFGDKDGEGDDVRMQHQQAIALHPSGRLLVADTYNDALKWLDPASRRAETWARGFHEPGGVACGAHFAYVADTNAHRIALVHWKTGKIGELELKT
ncbi:MAG: alkyl hydroperoxide reductase [Gemmatimonadota bacterium]|nr:alkyl hydroperoxide reductase [Gemmatimonadota bacterium]